jgi:asparagine synthase (glutamine-hydrolysing)
MAVRRTADGWSEPSPARQTQYGIPYWVCLGGRFTALLWEKGRLTVVPDCVASLPTYWHHSDSTLTLGSYAHLVGEVTGTEPNEPMMDLMRRAKQMSTPGTIYWPGVETPFIGVLPLLPNHTLTFDGHTVGHDRFYPFPDTALPQDPDDAYDQFRDLFTKHVKLLCGLGRVGVSLTGGMDSRATFKAARPHLGADALTWTYYKFRAPDPAMQADLLSANAVAREARVAHQVVAVELPPDGPFAEAYERSMRYTQQFRALAGAYHHQLPGDLVELQSMVAEVGTGFYKKRTKGLPTTQRLAQLYSNSDFGRLPEIASALEKFVDYADFRADRFDSVDWHDLYYWEARIGRWGTLRMQEVDLSHQLMLPFNARGIVEALQAPPLESRVKKQALARYIA